MPKANEDGTKDWRGISIRTETHWKLHLLAAKTEMKYSDIIDSLVTEGLEREEQRERKVKRSAEKAIA